MHLCFCVGPANIALELIGYAARTEELAQQFFSQFEPRSELPTWSAELTADPQSASHLGATHLALGPVGPTGNLSYPELTGLPLRHGAPRAMLHGVMGLIAHFLRRRGDRLVHAAGCVLPNYGSVVAIGISGAGKSTLTSVLGGREMGDEGIALQWQSGELRAQACLVPGERLPGFWQSEPLAALLIPAHDDQTSIVRVQGHEALIALGNAIVRLRGDELFTDFDWAHRALKDVPVYRVGWALAQSPVIELKRALDASR